MVDIIKKGSAHWEGSIKEGKGTISTESGALSQQPYGFNTRFEDKVGTNPEEIIGAAVSQWRFHYSLEKQVLQQMQLIQKLL
ncbi:hypothetical protein [Acinetobacter nectaris]|uniref:hypothetical protein n=1 Tax=Acinetobacter nectaris TaxID=1219382 RepID=UPI0023514985|nr:hypothetical protein [Acinetobacter nectaris]